MDESIKLDEQRRRTYEDATMFRSLIDQSRDAIFVTDLETGRFLYVNHQACRSLGYSRTELLSARVSDIEETLSDPKGWDDHWREIDTRGTVVRQGRHRRKDGSTFQVEVSARVLRSKEGSCVLASARDISHRQGEEADASERWDLLEDLIRERSAVLHQVNETLEQEVLARRQIQEDLTFSLEREQVVARTLERFVTGDRLDDALQGTLEDLGRLTGADRAYLFRLSQDRETMSNTHQWCAPGVESQSTQFQQLPVIRFPWWTERMLGGDPLSITNVGSLPPEAAAERELLEAQQITSLLAIPFAVEGDIAGFIGLDNVARADPLKERDLTYLQITTEIVRQVMDKERAKERLGDQEAQYRSFIEHASDLVLVVDGNLRVRSANSAAARFIGIEVAELEGRHVRDLAPPGLSDEYESFVRRVMEGGSPEMVESNIDVGTGSRMLLTTITPLPGDRSPDRGGVLIVAHDVTELKSLEQAVRHSQKMDALGRMAGGIAHDFNNLLSIINNYAGFLLDALDEADPRRSDAMEIAKAGDRAASLTKQLLAFSRQEVVEQRHLSVHRVVSELERMLGHLVGEDIGLQVRLDTPRVQVVASPGSLEQVILNLVINARDAMPGGGSLVVSTREVTIGPAEAQHWDSLIPGRYVELSVADNGSGMSPEVIERAIEPFFTTKPEGSGTGLGLATVYGIVKQLGGDIQIDSTVGAGTTMRVLLPSIKADTVERPAIGKGRPPAPATRSVLLVEDDASVRTMIVRVLRSDGIEVQEAADGNQGAEAIDGLREPVDLLITDVVMPGMSGPEVARRYLERHPDKPVLLISGYAPDESLASLLELPAVRFLSKPFSPLDLLSLIDDLLKVSTPRRILD